MTQRPSAPWEIAPRVFVIAEIGVNHNGDRGLALELVDVAANAGADAVKFQTFVAERLAAASAPKADYQDQQDPDSTSQIAMLKRLELTADDYRAVKARAEERNILFMSTPFDEDSADFLSDLGVSLYKVSSGDLTHLDYLRHLAGKGLPIIISTGMGTLSEVEDAVRAIEEAGDPPLAILHCVSNYPAAPEESNIRAIDTIASAFGKPTGWSDHMTGGVVTLAAVARGARIVEKHFTLDRSLPGPDHAASLEPEELKQYVADIRMVEAALGDGVKRPSEAELKVAAVARRSIAAAVDLKEGEIITAEKLIFLRPSTGIVPKRRPDIVGRKVARAIAKGDILQWEDIGA